MSESEARAYRLGVAMAIMAQSIPYLFFDRGMGMPTGEFNPGAFDALADRLGGYVLTGKLPPKRKDNP